MVGAVAVVGTVSSFASLLQIGIKTTRQLMNSSLSIKELPEAFIERSGEFPIIRQKIHKYQEKNQC